MGNIDFNGVKVSEKNSEKILSLNDIAFFLSPIDTGFVPEKIYSNLNIDFNEKDRLELGIEKLLERFFRKPNVLKRFIIQQLEDISHKYGFKKYAGLLRIIKGDDGFPMILDMNRTVTMGELFKLVAEKKRELVGHPVQGEISEEKITGILKRIIEDKNEEGFVFRESQEMMVKEVGKALTSSGNLVVEAPTGTGKTLAYLIPAILQSYFSKDPVFISTFTRSLQMQVFKKEVKLLKKYLPDFNATVLFGRENYPCVLKLFYNLEKNRGLIIEDVKNHLVFFGIVAQFLDGYLNKTLPFYIFPSGLIDENDFQTLFAEIMSRREDCYKKKCNFYKSCPYFSSIKNLSGSNIGIVNHWNLLTHVAEGNFKNITCIIDEADKFESAATSTYTAELSSYFLFRILKSISTGKKHRVKTLEEVLYSNNSIPKGEIRNFTSKIKRRINRIRRMIFREKSVKTGGKLEISIYDEIENPKYEPILKFLHKLRVEFYKLKSDISLFIEEKKEEIEEHHYLNIKFSYIVDTLEFITDTLLRGLEEEDDPENENISWVSIFSTDQNGGWELSVKPVLPGPLLNKYFYPSIETAVFTSATVSVDNSLDYFMDLTGLEDFRWKQLPSPFNLREQMQISVIEDIPEYSYSNKTDFRKYSVSSLKKIISHFQGRILVLFTSYGDMYHVYNNLRTDPDIGSELLVQRGGIWYREYINDRFGTIQH